MSESLSLQSPGFCPYPTTLPHKCTSMLTRLVIDPTKPNFRRSCRSDSESWWGDKCSIDDRLDATERANGGYVMKSRWKLAAMPTRG